MMVQTNTENKKKIPEGRLPIRRIVLPSIKSMNIATICRSHCFTTEDCTVGEVAAQWNDMIDIPALAVLDKKSALIGIVIKLELFNTLSRPYGLDVFRKKSIAEAAVQVPEFHFERNIFSVSDEITGNDKNLLEEKYFVLTDGSRYIGIFSSKDMLSYLSGITKRDLQLARRIQGRVVKDSQIIRAESYEIMTSSRMAKAVGGDFSLINKISGDKIMIVLCDVSGKGYAASLVTTALWGVFSAYPYMKGMKSFIKHLNRHILESFEHENYLTGLFCMFHPEKAELDIFDMGHSLIYLLRDRKLKIISTKGDNPPVGIIEEVHPVKSRLKLEKGDIIVLASDGLWDQTNSEDTYYSIKRFSSVLINHLQGDISRIKKAVAMDFENFRGKQTQADDVTLIYLRYNG